LISRYSSHQATQPVTGEPSKSEQDEAEFRCHVLAHESFENEEIAKIMNENFVNIKVDREERPDVDRMYMTFLQVSVLLSGLIFASSPLTSRLLQVVEDGQCQYVRCMKH